MIVYRFFLELDYIEPPVIFINRRYPCEDHIFVAPHLTKKVWVFNKPSEKCKIRTEVLNEDDFKKRKEKCRICIDEKYKIEAIIEDDLAHHRFHILIERRILESLTPLELFVTIEQLTKHLSLVYIPVKPILRIPPVPKKLDVLSEHLKVLLVN